MTIITTKAYYTETGVNNLSGYIRSYLRCLSEDAFFNSSTKISKEHDYMMEKH
jgi:hypothetical protein